jgi:hypothetical protein
MSPESAVEYETRASDRITDTILAKLNNPAATTPDFDFHLGVTHVGRSLSPLCHSVTCHLCCHPIEQ